MHVGPDSIPMEPTRRCACGCGADDAAAGQQQRPAVAPHAQAEAVGRRPFNIHYCCLLLVVRIVTLFPLRRVNARGGRVTWVGSPAAQAQHRRTAPPHPPARRAVAGGLDRARVLRTRTTVRIVPYVGARDPAATLLLPAWTGPWWCQRRSPIRARAVPWLMWMMVRPASRDRPAPMTTDMTRPVPKRTDGPTGTSLQEREDKRTD